MTDRKAFEEGMILALVSPQLPHVAKKEPIAYSYNGVVLPGLPEWDREMYPYAWLSTGGLAAKNQMWLYVVEEIEFTGSGIVYRPGCLRASVQDITAENPEWGEFEQVTTGTNISKMFLRWSNVDICYPDDYSDADLAGTVYLEASDPMPVYE